jgi:hypothetical protein
MARLRIAVMAVALSTGVTGCAFAPSPSRVAHYSIWHCDECDDFPMPAYGPGYSMMPGSYTRHPTQGSLESKPSANGATDSESVAPPQQVPAPPPATTTPPPTPGAPPGQNTDARQPASGGTGPPSTIATRVDSNLPAPPAGMRNDPQGQATNP